MSSTAEMASDLMESAGAQQDVDAAVAALRGLGRYRDDGDGLFAIQWRGDGQRLTH